MEKADQQRNLDSNSDILFLSEASGLSLNRVLDSPTIQRLCFCILFILKIFPECSKNFSTCLEILPAIHAVSFPGSL